VPNNNLITQALRHIRVISDRPSYIVEHSDVLLNLSLILVLYYNEKSTYYSSKSVGVSFLK